MHVLMGVSSDLYLHDPLRQCQHAEVIRHAHMLDGIHTRSAYTIASCRSTEPHPPLTTTYPATSLPELVWCAWWLSRSCSSPRSSHRVRPQPAAAACENGTRSSSLRLLRSITAPHPPMIMMHPATASPELNGSAWWLSRSSSRLREAPRSVHLLPLQSHATHALVSKSSEHQEVSHSVLCVMWSSTGCTMHGFNSQASIP